MDPNGYLANLGSNAIVPYQIDSEIPPAPLQRQGRASFPDTILQMDYRAQHHDEYLVSFRNMTVQASQDDVKWENVFREYHEKTANKTNPEDIISPDGYFYTLEELSEFIDPDILARLNEDPPQMEMQGGQEWFNAENALPNIAVTETSGQTDADGTVESAPNDNKGKKKLASKSARHRRDIYNEGLAVLKEMVPIRIENPSNRQALEETTEYIFLIEHTIEELKRASARLEKK